MFQSEPFYSVSGIFSGRPRSTVIVLTSRLWMGLLIRLSETCTSFGQGVPVLRTNMELGMIIAGIVVAWQNTAG